MATGTASAGGTPASTTVLRQQLAQVPGTPRGSTVVYRRSSFGPAWQSTDGSPCRTRDQVLARTLSDVARRPDSHCVVTAGDFTDPYTGTRQHFTKDRAARFPIDHVVPLGWIWTHGAWAWSERQRLEFANDLTVPELQLTTTAANDAKGDKGPAAWLPANRADHCAYAAAWVAVLHAWQQRTGQVTIDAASRAALQRILATC